jgi:hypothetical protein
MALLDPTRTSLQSRVLHWTGCILGTLLVLLCLAFAIGVGWPPFNIGVALLVATGIGFLLSWWHGLTGGVLSLLAIASFYVWNFTQSGTFPSGWVFPLCFVPGILQSLACFVDSLRFSRARL